MQWDDELERLSNAVVEAFGEQALNAAIERAYGHAAMLLKTEPSQRPPVATAAASTPAPAAGPTSFEECLRAELRRMLRPH
jgi:hypothetical protein